MKKVQVTIFAVVFFGISLVCWFMPDKETSDSERRVLAQFPEVKVENILNGQLESEFEKYTSDQFPLRDTFRSLKALTEYGVFRKKDNNDIFVVDGNASKLLYPYNESSVLNATDKFNDIYNNFLKDSGSEGKIYVSVIPDKSYFMAAQNAYPSIDYDYMFAQVAGEMDYAQYVDITECLTLDDYYKTDLHWKQDRIIPVAKILAEAMKIKLEGIDSLKKVKATDDFHGVYYGQSALPLPAETLYYMTSDMIDNCITFNFETEKEGRVYDLEKLKGRDPYDVYVSGAAALITIENPSADIDRELIMFRDSFGSSLAPLLISNYSKITLVDIRYIQTSFLDRFIEFNGQDVLFLYGTTILNDSYTFK